VRGAGHQHPRERSLAARLPALHGLEHRAGKIPGGHERDTAQELQDVLGRAKFDRYLRRSDRALFVGVIHRPARRLDVAAEHLQAASRYPDPNDAPSLGLALSAEARYLVSSDADLLGCIPSWVPKCRHRGLSFGFTRPDDTSSRTRHRRWEVNRISDPALGAFIFVVSRSDINQWFSWS